MKILSTNYKISALKTIYKDAVDQGLEAEINKFTDCVDILDGNGCIIEQRYPTKGEKAPGTRNRYQYVGPGNGDYCKIVVQVNEQTYETAEPYIKYVYKTSDPTDVRTNTAVQSSEDLPDDDVLFVVSDESYNQVGPVYTSEDEALDRVRTEDVKYVHALFPDGHSQLIFENIQDWFYDVEGDCIYAENYNNQIGVEFNNNVDVDYMGKELQRIIEGHGLRILDWDTEGSNIFWFNVYESFPDSIV